MSLQLTDSRGFANLARGQHLLSSPQARVVLGAAALSACLAALAPQSAEAASRRSRAVAPVSGPTTCGSVAGATLQFGDNTISNIVCSGGLRARTPLTFLSNGPDFTFGITRPIRGASISYTLATRQPSSQVFGTVGLNSGCVAVGNPRGTCTFTAKVMDASGNEISSLTSTNGSTVAPFSLTSDHTVLNILNTFNSSRRSVVLGAVTTLTQRGLNPPPTNPPPTNSVLPTPPVVGLIPIDEIESLEFPNGEIPPDTTLPGTDPNPIQPDPNGASVPGPLPLLGSAAAFGFSRRIRARIRQSAAAKV